MANTKNYAFIDGNNLYLGAKSQGIKLHYGDLRLYLKNRLKVDKVFLFIGYDPDNAMLYKTLQSYGYILIFKPTITYTENGKRTMKGNVDAELVLHSAAIEYDNYDKAVIITSDGDFTCLIKYLKENNKLSKIITLHFFNLTLLIFCHSAVSNRMLAEKNKPPKMPAFAIGTRTLG